MMPYLISAFTVAVVVNIVNVILWFRKKLTFDAFFGNLIAFVLLWTLVMIVQSSLGTAVYKTQSMLVETKPLVVFQINGRDMLATRTQASPQMFEYMYTFLVPDELGVPKRIDGFVLSDRFEVVFTASNQTSRLEIYDVVLTAKGSEKWLQYIVPITESPLRTREILYIPEEMVFEIPEKEKQK